MSDLQAAKTLSAQTGKPVLVDFSATWCGPCQAMIHDTFPDPDVAPLLRKLICVRVDVDLDPKDAQQFQVDGIPRILMLAPNARGAAAKMDVTGYEEPVAFADDLRSALGMPPLPGSVEAQTGQPAPNSPADTVARALAGNRYGKLKASNPAAAKQGLQEIIGALGEASGDQESPIQPEILARAGDDAKAALLAAMGSGYLAQRVGAFAMLRRIVPAAGGALFDPWAKQTVRAKQLKAFAARVGKPAG